MTTQTQYGQAFLIDGLDAEIGRALTRIPFVKGEGADYNECWIQKLMMRHPTLLPLKEIEPAFVGLRPVCMELPLSSGGFLDNLLVTPRGNLALVECKLYRNPEARRKAIAQIIDYAIDVATWTYQELEGAIHKTLSLDGSGNKETRGLYEIVSSEGEFEESLFIEEVSKHLRLGQFLLLIVGDGIQQGVEDMTQFLQQHAGLHFTLGLIELAVLKMPTDGYIIQPRTIAKTINIPRGIVKFEDSRISIVPPSVTSSSAGATPRPMTITKEQYLEQLESAFPGIAKKVESLLEKLQAHRVVADFGTKSMILRWHLEDGALWNVGTILVNGDLWINLLDRRAHEMGLQEFTKQFLSETAALIPGAVVRETPKETGWYVCLNGRGVKVDCLLEDEDRIQSWVDALARFQSGVKNALDARA